MGLAEIRGSDPGSVGPTDSSITAVDGRERLVVLSLEFSRRSLEARSLEELYFILTNDTRALIEFDRSFLISHMRGESRLVAAGNQPVVDNKSKFHEELNRLAAELRSLGKPIFLTSPDTIESIPDDVAGPRLKDMLAQYMRFARSTGLFCVPMIFNGEPVGHLILECLDGNAPEQINMVAVAKLAPIFAAALAKRWILARNPGLLPLTEPASWRRKPLAHFLSYLPALVIAALAMITVLFVIPVSHPVGGEAQIVPSDRHLAFSKIEGLIEQIRVTEGAQVTKGQVLAIMDPTELDFKIKGAQRELELLTAENTLLKKSAAQDVSKLAESGLVELKAKSTSAGLEYLQWQRRFLQIKAPASGIITTKNVETLVGKKFKAGEPFCEIAVPGELWTEIYVPEDSVSNIKPGQTGNLWLNNQPRHAYSIQVKEVAPRAEAVPRMGNVYRVRAIFSGDETPSVKVGMKGVGTIYTEKSNLYSIIAQRVYERWNQFALHFL
jgi:multidrug resistance efflux pump